MSGTIFVVFCGVLPKSWFHYRDQAEECMTKHHSNEPGARIEEIDSTERHYSDTFRALEIKAGLLWQVKVFLSNPEDENDDLHAEESFASELASTDAFNAYFKPGFFDREMLQNDLWIVWEGPKETITRQLRPGFVAKPRPASYDADRAEGAMMAGMAFGCQGYNDYMGY